MFPPTPSLPAPLSLPPPPPHHPPHPHPRSYYYLGETMVDEKYILCSGTTLGTVAGITAYLTQGMGPAADVCNEIGWEKGMDQGIHNVLLQHYSSAEWTAIRAKAALDDEPRFAMANKAKLLEIVSGLQSGLIVDLARSEDGFICTMALLLQLGLTRDGEGFVAKHGDASNKCTIVHQIDRDGGLNEWYTQRFKLAGTG